MSVIYPAAGAVVTVISIGSPLHATFIYRPIERASRRPIADQFLSISVAAESAPKPTTISDEPRATSREYIRELTARFDSY
jgi:hypothetical protein